MILIGPTTRDFVSADVSVTSAKADGATSAKADGATSAKADGATSAKADSATSAMRHNSFISIKPPNKELRDDTEISASVTKDSR